MADDGVKISALNEILTEPATGEMAAVVSGGVTYKRDIGKRLPSTAQKSALAGYGGAPSGSNPYVTQTGAATIATNLATPLSDLNRVFHLTGNGIPTFPDNVAGKVYDSNYATTDGWIGSGATLSVSGGKLIATATATFVAIIRAFAYGSGKQVVIKYKGSRSLGLYGTVDGATDQNLGGTTFQQGGWTFICTYVSGNLTGMYLANGESTVGDIFEISDAYVGSGLFDTPVYGADGKSAWTNHGVVPVPGERGNAMLFQRSQFLEGQQEWGNSGVFAFKYNRKTTGINEYIISDNDFWSNKGKGIFISDGQTLYFIYGNGTTNTVVGLVGSVIADGNHDYVVHFTESTIGPVYRDGVLVYTQTSLSGTIPPSGLPPRIGAGSSVYGGGDRLGGVLSDPRFDTGSWTADDVLRYHNGDDAVDSQQKAITNVPNAIKICDSKGNIRQPGLPVYANNTAALAGGLVAGEPYRTSTGVLMVVF